MTSNAPLPEGTATGHGGQDHLITQALHSRVGIDRQQSTLRQFARNRVVLFLAAGFTSYVADAGLLMILVTAFHVATWLAATVAFWTGVAVAFLLNRAVFANPRSDRLGSQSVRYATLLTLNYAVTLAGLAIAGALAMNLLAAKTLLIGAASIWNYHLYRRWVFR